MWNLPGPGIKFLSPELASRFLTTGPLGKSGDVVLEKFFSIFEVVKILLIGLSLFEPVSCSLLV